MSEIYPVSRKADIVVQEFEHETLVYDLKTNKALVLNSTSAIVWQLSDGKNTIDEIALKMSVILKQIISADLVLMSLEQLKKENLLKIESIENTPFEGLSRREMVRKIGFASIVTLPLISTLIAPSAINAASCAINLQGTGCTANFQCCSPATTCTNASPTRRCCVGSGDNTNGSFAPSVDIPATTCATLSPSVADSACDTTSGPFCCSGNAIYSNPPPCSDQPGPIARIRCRCVP